MVFAYPCIMGQDDTDARLKMLGAAIKEARISQGLSQTRLAQMIGQSNGQPYIHRIESGTSVAMAVIIKIADALGVKVSELIDF